MPAPKTVPGEVEMNSQWEGAAGRPSEVHSTRQHGARIHPGGIANDKTSGVVNGQSCAVKPETDAVQEAASNDMLIKAVEEQQAGPSSTRTGVETHDGTSVTADALESLVDARVRALTESSCPERPAFDSDFGISARQLGSFIKIDVEESPTDARVRALSHEAPPGRTAVDSDFGISDRRVGSFVTVTTESRRET
jgi:hypothetical protein